MCGTRFYEFRFPKSDASGGVGGIKFASFVLVWHSTVGHTVRAQSVQRCSVRSLDEMDLRISCPRVYYRVELRFLFLSS